MIPPEDGGDAAFARFSADLTENRQRGVRAVRINGYDPLSYSRILDVLHLARELGYESVDIFSPCTLLDDLELCRSVVDRLPATRRIYVPVYGATSAVHDAVVGTRGAFERVSAALANLRSLLAPHEIVLIGVATRGALEGLVDAAEWAGSAGLGFSAHMPYPSTESKRDGYFESVPRQTDVATTMAEARGRGIHLSVHGVAPCVTFRAMRDAGVSPDRWLPFSSRSRPLPGTEYRSHDFVHAARRAEHSAFDAPSVPCPHVGECALSAPCPREIAVAYLEEFGADELRPNLNRGAARSGRRAEPEGELR